MIERWAGKKEGWLCVVHIKQLLLSAHNPAGRGGNHPSLKRETRVGEGRAADEGFPA